LTDAPWSYGTDVSVPGYSTYSATGQPANLSVIYASAALTKFRNYMNSMTFPFTYDLAASFVEWEPLFLWALFFLIIYIEFKTLFHSKDIWGDPFTGSTPDQQSQVVGLAYIAAVCSSNRYSINEEHGGMRSVHVR
jgi:hypothetical protein